MKKLLLLILFASLPSQIYSQSAVLEAGEELKYDIMFGFIKLGELKYKLTEVSTAAKGSTCSAKMEIKTLPNVPFLNINKISEAVLFYNRNDNEVYTTRYAETEFENKTIKSTIYNFDYKTGTVKIVKEKNGGADTTYNASIDKEVKYQDKLSNFFNARLNSFKNANFILPVFVNEKESTVRYSFNTNQTGLTIKSVDYNVDVIKAAGVIDYTDDLGGSGEFITWYSNDQDRVPLKMQLNSSIGSITIELSSYKKKYWKPPIFIH